VIEEGEEKRNIVDEQGNCIGSVVVPKGTAPGDARMIIDADGTGTLRLPPSPAKGEYEVRAWLKAGWREG
jgi:hypothetical protein